MSKHKPDCRKCAHRGKVVKGSVVVCALEDEPVDIPWEDAVDPDFPCMSFTPRKKGAAR